MNQDPFRNLRFVRRPSTWSRRLIPIGISLAVFTILWVLISPDAMFWLLLALVALLVWMASYGWRQALSVIHDLLHRISNF